MIRELIEKNFRLRSTNPDRADRPLQEAASLSAPSSTASSGVAGSNSRRKSSASSSVNANMGFERIRFQAIRPPSVSHASITIANRFFYVGVGSTTPRRSLSRELLWDKERTEAQASHSLHPGRRERGARSNP